MRESDFAQLLQSAGASLAIFVLSLAGLAVATKLTWGPLFFFLFIISLFQGGLMIPAFKPAFGGGDILTLRDQVVGWTGFIGWFLTYLVMAGMISGNSLKDGIWILGIALLLYFICHTITLRRFYRRCFGFTSRQPVIKKSLKTIEQEERERQQREMAEQQRRIDQQKRDEARMSCLLLYDEHADSLATSFPRERMMEYFSRYLIDSLPAELVEQRSEWLKEMIESSMDSKDRNKRKFSSLSDITAYFQGRKQEIESLDYDDSTKQSFLSSISQQEERITREFLSS